MTPSIRIVSWIRASDDHRGRGLLGYLILELEGLLVLDAVTLRRTKRGTLLLSFPERTDAQGHRHPIVRPRNRAARHHLDRAVFQQLQLLAPTLVTEES